MRCSYSGRDVDRAASPAPRAAARATPGSSRPCRRSCSRSSPASGRRRGRSSRRCSRRSRPRAWADAVQILAVVRELRELVRFDVMQRVGERHLAVAMMVAVALAVGGDVDQLRPVAAVRIRVQQAVREDSRRCSAGPRRRRRARSGRRRRKMRSVLPEGSRARYARVGSMRPPSRPSTRARRSSRTSWPGAAQES